MTTRQYRDPSGTIWEVFEVHRHTERSTAVRPALMSGWLAFVSANEKRRLPQYPAEWVDYSDDELHELYLHARVAPAAIFPVVGPEGLGTRKPASQAEPEPAPPLPADTRPSSVEGEPSQAERLVRDHARKARADGVPVIRAMMDMKRILRDAGEEVSPATIRSARRWFVESFYFHG